ncbi:MAG: helix-turn-helix transcriptional regulator [Phycisphaerales bacterium]|nr:helix-turn-helix transcriptional regulator [Phycisphaerales bacterium]
MPPASTPQSVGDSLRHQRISMLGLGLREMAGILDIAPAHLTDLEKGRRNPSEDLLLRIAKHYRLDIAVLRAGWSKPDAIVAEIATQDATTSAKAPEFLRAARTLGPEQWDDLIARARRMAAGSRRSDRR